MIEISAKLIGGPVYLPGENVGCYITFMNPPLPNDIRSRSHRDDLEVLAWATAQIHCQCSTNGKVPLPSKTPYLPEEKVVSNSGLLHKFCLFDDQIPFAPTNNEIAPTDYGIACNLSKLKQTISSKEPTEASFLK
ncbi:Golgi membrane exchange factor (Ric1p-Rgp1p) subunit [Homalodisca vitripennis]|nr:Golgi membrane exchange factor (Ric1p-Rgp1p) subunit [Homalodisca vitripennis]